MEAQVPTSIQLGGSTINIQIVDNPMETGNDAWVSMSDSRIRISKAKCGLPCSNDYIESSYYHELVHAILSTMDKKELNENEEFVEGFGNLLHQAIKTAKY